MPPSAPRITITSPASGSVATGAQFTVHVEVANFQLVDFAGSPADSAGHGHYRLLVDGTADGASFTTSANTLSTHGSGVHEVRAELVQNSGTPLTPPVIDKVRISVP